MSTVLQLYLQPLRKYDHLDFILKNCLKWSSAAISEVLRFGRIPSWRYLTWKHASRTPHWSVRNNILQRSWKSKNDLRDTVTGLLKMRKSLTKFSKEMEKDYKRTSRSVIPSTFLPEKNIYFHLKDLQRQHGGRMRHCWRHKDFGRKAEHGNSDPPAQQQIQKMSSNRRTDTGTLDSRKNTSRRTSSPIKNQKPQNKIMLSLWNRKKNRNH